MVPVGLTRVFVTMIVPSLKASQELQVLKESHGIPEMPLPAFLNLTVTSMLLYAFLIWSSQALEKPKTYPLRSFT